ncbi:hypothetical protein PS1_033091 [Malus domestica]
MLLVMSYFRQEDVFLVIKTINQSDPQCLWILFSKVLGFQEVMNMSLDEDHGSGFLSFANRVVRLIFNGGTQILCSEVEFHILDPLEVVPFSDLQNGKVEFVQIRYVPITK